MKKLKYILTSTVFALFLVGCDSQQPSQDVEPVAGTERYPTPSFTFSGGSLTTNESNESVYTYDVALDKPIGNTIDFSFVQTGGNATLHEDFEFVNTSVPAFGTTGQMSIVINNDLDPESTETLNFTIQSGPSIANRYLVNPNSTYPTGSITIENYTADDLVMSFDWDRGIEFAGTVYGTCANIDLDIFVSNADGFDINNPWATFNGTNYAATGNCPEEFDWIMSDWGDGDFVIWHENWSNGFRGLGTNTLVPITASIARPGVFNATIVQDDSQALNSDNDGEDDELPTDTHGIICLISVSNGVYTVSDYSGAVVASGKTNTAKTKRPSIDKVETAIKTLH